MVLFWKPKILNGFDGKSYVCAGGLPCKNIQYYYYIIIVIIIIVNIIIILLSSSSLLLLQIADHSSLITVRMSSINRRFSR